MAQSGIKAQIEHYAQYHGRGVGERDFFLPFMVVSLIVFGTVGNYLRINKPPPDSIKEKMERLQLQTRFIIQERKPVPKIEKPKLKKKKEVTRKKEKSIDLTKKPLPNQEKDEIDKEPPKQVRKKPVRRVYGLKKVYSKGIGASGSTADAIIGKRGNTLDTEIDTITATDADIQGEPISITS